MKPDRANQMYWIGGLALLSASLFLFVPPIPQSEAYHLFADGRTIFGIPNFWNVASNLPFAAVGLLGLWKLHGTVNRVLFAGVFLTCFGSSYYHWAPDDARLVWDRLPMTVVFMSFLTSIVVHDSPTRATVRTLALLVACGVSSVVWWIAANDLRPYLLVQFIPMLVVIPSLRRAPGRTMLLAVMALYTLAKLSELCDQGVYSVLSISGHTCKHLLAALAAYYMYRWQLRADSRAASEASASVNVGDTLRAVSN
ncbi:MAG TPA: hypothetical protein VMH80_25975 [Bryobacteraceae bacterium]|nr:hypothetical protein [Bryobacteraceae bacterium]